MRRGYEVTAAARLDLLHIWNYLAENESLDVADGILKDIETAIEKVVRSPFLGHLRPDLTKRPLFFYGIHS